MFVTPQSGVMEINMGFGTLLIGYTFAYLITVGLGDYAFIGLMVGHFIMYHAISELKKYASAFDLSYILSVMLIICAAFECVVGIDEMLVLGMSIGDTVVADIAEVTRFVLDAAFNIALLYGIADLARTVDLPSVRFASYRNMFFVGAYYVAQVIVSAVAEHPGEIFAKYSSFIMTVLLLLKLLYVIFNIGLLFKCYAFICPSDDVDMKRKPSRFEFINKMHEKTDAREEEAIQATKEYLEQKAQKKKEKQSRSNNAHKKKK